MADNDIINQVKEWSPGKMISTDKSRNCRMTNVERLSTLFKAFREGDEEVFRRTAESFINDELTANHHEQARDLQKALVGNGSSRTSSRTFSALTQLPKDKRRGDPLISVIAPDKHRKKLVLEDQTRVKIERLLQEHGQRAKLAEFGFKPKSRVLFWGPPGCGKTMTAHWIAGELGLPLVMANLSGIITSFLGETAANIQRVFAYAEESPMVLFLDEADAISKERDDRNDVGELKRVVNSVLYAMDQFSRSGSILIAASNHQYLFDSALWRRFDDVVNFPIPSSVQSREFVSHLINGVKVSGNIEAAIKSANSLSFSELESCVTEVIKTMVLEDRNEIKTSELANQFRIYIKQMKVARSRLSSKIKKHE